LAYFVPLGDDGWLEGESVDGEPDGVLDDGGGVAVGGGVVVGEADGGWSPGRSPTRSVRDSPQPAIRLAPAARASIALSKLFIPLPPEIRAFDPGPQWCNRGATQARP
jgi:hypothetical protein